MKFTGISRKLDPLGRITIPKEIRKILKIKEDHDYIGIHMEGETICLRKIEKEKQCAICKTEEFLMDIDGVCVCGPCARGVGNAIAREHLKK